MKERLNKEINLQLDRWTGQKMKFDDIGLELRHTQERLREQKVLNDDLNIRFKVNSEELRNELDQKKLENSKKRDQAEMLADNGKKLENAVFQVSQEIKVLEGTLQSLRSKHEFSVNDLSNHIRRLEQDN